MLYMRNVCEELRYPNEEENKIFCDSESSILWLEGENISTSTKHVETRLYRMRHLVKSGGIDLEYIKTEENIADMFTKSLPRSRFEYLRRKVMGHDLVEGKGVIGVPVD